MAGTKPPAYQWYPKDYENDEAVKLMTYEQEGVYRRLLDHQALHGSIPADQKQIALLVPKVTRARFRKLWVGMSGKFQPTTEGRLANARMARSQSELVEFKVMQSENGKKGARKRWHVDSESHGELIATPLANASPASATASASALSEPSHEGSERRGDPPVRQAFERFKRRFFERFETDPEFARDKDAGIFSRLIKRRGVEELLQLIDEFFASPDAWIQGSGYTVGAFGASVNKLLSRRSKSNGPPLSETASYNLAASTDAERLILEADARRTGTHGHRR